MQENKGNNVYASTEITSEPASNKLAIISLVLGIIGLGLSFVIIGFPVAILAIIVSIISLKKISKEGLKGTEFAMVGLVTGIAGVVVALLMGLAVMRIFLFLIIYASLFNSFM